MVGWKFLCCNVFKWENTWSLRRTIAKYIEDMERSLKQKLFTNKFLTKKVQSTFSSISRRGEVRGLQKLALFIHFRVSQLVFKAQHRKVLNKSCSKLILNNFCLKCFLIQSKFSPCVEPWRQLKHPKMPENRKFSKPPNSTPMGDRRKMLWTFIVGNSSMNNFQS